MSDAFRWGDRLPTLEASRLRLRWLRDSDVAALFAIFSDASVMRYWSSPPLVHLDAAHELLRDIQELFERRVLYQWGIARSEDDGVIGTCTLFHIDNAQRRGEIGFALGREWWGQGLATEAVETMIAFAFDSLDLRRLEADADPRNAASLRLLEGQGFGREGHLRERYEVSGEIQDAVYLGLLRREWTPRQEAP